MLTEMYVPFVLESSWQRVLQDELKQPYMVELAVFVEQERAGPLPIYPPKDLVFNAFKYTPYDAVKVVVVGQDPYHGPGQAHGLSFSVPEGIPQPPSLQNIFKELADDVGVPISKAGCLVSWAKQGIMLLNATLTVRHKQPMSHAGRGWERFTDAVIAKLNEREDPMIFVLWGASARKKCPHIHSRHTILTSAHPSPLSAHHGFFGSKPFSKINALLQQWGKEPINWAIP